MNTNIVVTNERQWPIAPYPADGSSLGAGQRSYSAAAILDFPTLMRILHHWRWLVLGAIGLGLAGAILVSLLTVLDAPFAVRQIIYGLIILAVAAAYTRVTGEQ